MNYAQICTNPGPAMAKLRKWGTARETRRCEGGIFDNTEHLKVPCMRFQNLVKRPIWERCTNLRQSWSREGQIEQTRYRQRDDKMRKRVGSKNWSSEGGVRGESEEVEAEVACSPWEEQGRNAKALLQKRLVTAAPNLTRSCVEPDSPNVGC